MGPDEMTWLGGWIADVLEAPADDAVKRRVAGEVADVAARFPIYAEPVAS
jgi:glycine hydroxymethyltransferase